MGPQAVSVIAVERVYDGWQHSLWREGVVVVNVCVTADRGAYLCFCDYCISQMREYADKLK